MEDLLSDVKAETRLASPGSRFGAALIDFALIAIVFYGFAHFWGESYSSDGESGIRLTGLPVLAFFAVGFLLLPLQEGLTGKTIGKRVMGITVKRPDLSDSNVGTSLVRHLFDIVDCFALLGLIVASTNAQRQRVGDLVARTIVVTDK